VGLQETMVGDCEDSLLRKFDVNHDYLWMWNASKGKSGGILVRVLIERYDVGSFRQGEYMIQLNLWDKILKIKWNLLVVCGSAHDENKMSFLAELSNLCTHNSEPMIISGDFNIIRYLKEKNTMDGVHRHTALFNFLIHFYGLRELVMNGGLFTWSNNQEPPILEKLDRILVTKEWKDISPQAMVTKLPREVSYHNPLIVSFGNWDKLPYIQFKFDLNWLKNPEFFVLVEKIWCKPYRAKTTIDKIQ
jgi:exonuclease III